MRTQISIFMTVIPSRIRSELVCVCMVYAVYLLESLRLIAIIFRWTWVNQFYWS